jgi:hypothetical protein
MSSVRNALCLTVTMTAVREISAFAPVTYVTSGIVNSITAAPPAPPAHILEGS